MSEKLITEGRIRAALSAWYEDYVDSKRNDLPTAGQREKSGEYYDRLAAGLFKYLETV